MNRTSIFFGISFDADIDAALVYHLLTNSGRTLYVCIKSSSKFILKTINSSLLQNLRRDELMDLIKDKLGGRFC